MVRLDSNDAQYVYTLKRKYNTDTEKSIKKPPSIIGTRLDFVNCSSSSAPTVRVGPALPRAVLSVFPVNSMLLSTFQTSFSTALSFHLVRALRSGLFDRLYAISDITFFSGFRPSIRIQIIPFPRFQGIIKKMYLIFHISDVDRHFSFFYTNLAFCVFLNTFLSNNTTLLLLPFLVDHASHA